MHLLRPLESCSVQATTATHFESRRCVVGLRRREDLSRIATPVYRGTRRLQHGGFPPHQSVVCRGGAHGAPCRPSGLDYHRSRTHADVQGHLHQLGRLAGRERQTHAPSGARGLVSRSRRDLRRNAARASRTVFVIWSARYASARSW